MDSESLQESDNFVYYSEDKFASEFAQKHNWNYNSLILSG